MSIVITGNPGVGKHTIAKKLAEKYSLEIIDINKIAKEVMTEKQKKGTIDIDTEKLKLKIKNVVKKNTLVVGHLAPYVLSRSQIKQVIVLRKNPYALEKIYKKRRYSKVKSLENIGSEILGIIAFDAIKNFGAKKVVQIESDSSISKTLQKVERVLNGVHSNKKIDWLLTVTKKNDLKKFFPY